MTPFFRHLNKPEVWQLSERILEQVSSSPAALLLKERRGTLVSDWQYVAFEMQITYRSAADYRYLLQHVCRSRGYKLVIYMPDVSYMIRNSVIVTQADAFPPVMLFPFHRHKVKERLISSECLEPRSFPFLVSHQSSSTKSSSTNFVVHLQPSRTITPRTSITVRASS